MTEQLVEAPTEAKASVLRYYPSAMLMTGVSLAFYIEATTTDGRIWLGSGDTEAETWTDAARTVKRSAIHVD